MRTYSALAAEYYDSRLHPTCRAFRDASHLVLDQWRPWLEGALLCEIGAGSSLLAEKLTCSSHSLALIDLSREMLNYSAPWGRNRWPIVADAGFLPVCSGCLDGVALILGDPYNTPALWSEVRRVLVSGGTVIFTTPAWAWAWDFRRGSLSAEFQLRDGMTVRVPSFIYPASVQCKMIECASFEVLEVREVSLSELNGDRWDGRAPVKLFHHNNPRGAVVTGFLARAK
jgi:SAM-dependent methyltransferase